MKRSQPAAKGGQAKKAPGKKAAPKKKVAPAAAAERFYFRQTDFPLFTLQDAQRVAGALVDHFGGREGTPPDVALSINYSPASSAWRELAGAAIAYGLTDGGPNADVIKLLALGKRLIAPEEEGDDVAARREAILKPRIAQEFFEKYRRAKFPGDVIALNVLKALGIPAPRAEKALEILKVNGKYAGIVRDTPTGLFVNLDSPGIPGPLTSAPLPDHHDDGGDVSPITAHLADRKHDAQPLAVTVPAAEAIVNNRVFITHGKQRSIVNQIKELLAFGNFEPVVSVERESTAIPVPEKVFEDMRGCAAEVIHVGAEGKYLDKDGNEHTKINDNVLIEIGAAMALYSKKVILLVEKGVSLPSNLQGLYRCEFEGDKLDYDSTMKLLKTFSQFR